MENTVRVEMSLTKKTCDQAEFLRQRFGCASKAQAVSISLSLAALLADAVQDGGMLLVKSPNKELQRLEITGLTG